MVFGSTEPAMEEILKRTLWMRRKDQKWQRNKDQRKSPETMTKQVEKKTKTKGVFDH